jgi:hypothetical protein
MIDAPLAEELERHGVHLHPGDRVRLQLVTERGSDSDELWDAFIGSFESDEPNPRGAERGDLAS